MSPPERPFADGAAAPGASGRLRGKIALLGAATDTALGRLWGHPRLAELWPEFMVLVHGMIRASVPLMEAALVRARDLAGGDPAAAGLARYLERHIPEERGHDDWLLADLEVLGWPPEAVWEQIPPAALAAVVGSQYYWIRHDHPVALLGYIAVLEGYPPDADRIEAVIARTGLPRQGFRTYLKHAHLDPHHRDDLDRALDELPLEPRQEALLGLSALTTRRALGELVGGLVARFDGQQRFARAV